MPFGKDGFELSDDGVIDKRMNELIQKHGQAIEPGRIVAITSVAFTPDGAIALAMVRHEVEDGASVVVGDVAGVVRSIG